MSSQFFLALLFVCSVHSGFIRSPDAQQSAPTRDGQPASEHSAQTPDAFVAESHDESSSCVDSDESLTCDLLVGEDKSICSKQLASGARVQDLCPNHCNCCNIGGQCTCNDDATVESIAQHYGVYYVHSCADALQHVQCNDTRFAKRLRQYCPCFCQETETPCFELSMTDYGYDGWNGAVLTVTTCDGETTFVSATLESGGSATGVHCFTPPEEGVVITVTSGTSPGEVFWSIADVGSDDPFVGGGAPSRYSFCEESSTPTPSPTPTSNCYAVHMYDTYGDGWNNAALTFTSCDGSVLASVTLVSGSSGTKSVCLDSGIDAFTVEVTSGVYPSEVSWRIEGPNSADAFLTGRAPYEFSTCPDNRNDSCVTFNLADSGGDGWNGATLTVSSCTTDEQYVTLSLEQGASGVIPFCFPESADDGVVVTVTSGENPEEVKFTVVNGGGETVLTGGAPFSWNQCNSTEDDGCVTFNLYDNGGDGWNGATLTVASCVTGEQYFATSLQQGYSDSISFCFPESAQSGVVVAVVTGERPEEVSFSVVNSDGETLLSGGAPFSWNECEFIEVKSLFGVPADHQPLRLF